jgi:hypothetical protein
MAAAAAGGGGGAQADVPIYLILGHGTEVVYNFNTRQQLPEGYTLVTYSQAGNASYRKEVCKTIGLFEDASNEELLRQVAGNKTSLEDVLDHSINVYTPGQRIPNLTITPVTSWDFDYIEFTKFQRCGVYTFPMRPNPVFEQPFQPDLTEKQIQRLQTKTIIKEDMSECAGQVAYFPYMNGKAERVAPFFKDSVYPTEDFVREKKNATLSNLKHNTKITLTDLMKKLGPGIYYYVICRACDTFYGLFRNQMETFFLYCSKIQKNLEPEYLETAEGQSQIALIKVFEARMKQFVPTILNEKNIQLALERFLELLAEYQTFPEYNALSNTVKEYISGGLPGEETVRNIQKYLVNLRFVRGKSQEQQRGRGLTRKRRTQHKQRKLKRKTRKGRVQRIQRI